MIKILDRLSNDSGGEEDISAGEFEKYADRHHSSALE